MKRIITLELKWGYYYFEKYACLTKWDKISFTRSAFVRINIILFFHKCLNLNSLCVPQRKLFDNSMHYVAL